MTKRLRGKRFCGKEWIMESMPASLLVSLQMYVSRYLSVFPAEALRD
jgi:hypothetical protein